MNKKLKISLSIIFLLFILLIILISSGAKVYTDFLWFQNLGFVQTFLIMFFSNFGLRIILGGIFTLFIFFNLIFTRKLILRFLKGKKREVPDGVESLFDEKKGMFDWLNKKRLNIIFALGSIVLGFLFSSISQDIWKIVLKYINQVPFEGTDPLFGRNIGFYIFSLPFFNFIKEMSMVLVVLTLIVVGIIYIIVSGINSFNDLAVNLSSRGKKHMTILVSIFLFLKAWDYRLNMFELLYSERGVAFGASYTDIHANLLGLRILFVIAIVIGVLLLFSLFRKNYKLIFWGLGFWLITSLIFGSIYPNFVQRFQVEPNELNRERPYISNNINMTLKAYNLENIEENKFIVKNNLEERNLDEYEDIIQNVRLWDPRPIKATYGQLQELRQYYTFNDIDIDRYNIDGEYRQVMLSPREMNQQKLPQRAQTWINRTLQYTHGFGIAMNSVGEVKGDGLPEFLFKDIPPQTNTDIELNNSSIYYGELTNNYVISNTNSNEFHYPSGDKNIYTSYDGTGGVQANNFLRKSLFALRFGELKFLLSDDIHANSRIMFNRQISQRVRQVAPFLKFDQDPYVVIAEGQIYWIQDAYTTTDRYPYSEPYPGVGNYIRNSIKVVIDAYNGDMDFYIIDEDDPLAQTYKNIFPDLFTSGDKMSEELKNHIRYPVDYFKIQTDMYRVYHMTDPNVFYNKEDVWEIPQENYAGSTIEMEPYYMINQLPGKEDAEFLLMLPFTPAQRNNMISWMAARNDGDKFGELFLYNFPKDTLVYGPSQIESRIDQHGEISQALTLWSQRGSNVIRGNLLVIPIKNSILYIEPVFLEAETGQLPELRRVIVSYRNKIAMEPDLTRALEVVFGEREADYTEEVEEELEEVEEIQEETGAEVPDAEPDGEEEPEPEEPLGELPESVQELTREARDLYRQATSAQREGDWEEYGETLKQLEEVLNKLSEIQEE